MRRFNPTHADFDPVAALGPGRLRQRQARRRRKIVDAFERTEQAVDRIVAGRRRARSPSAATARSPSRWRARSARSTRRWRRCTSTRTPIPIPTATSEKYNSATQFTHVAEEGLVDPEFSWHVGIRSTTYAQGVVPRAHEPRLQGRVARRAGARRLRPAHGRVPRQGRQAAGLSLLRHGRVRSLDCAPGVCTPSWGGLSAREGIDLLRCLTDLNIVAVDVNTVSPPQDVNGMAAHLCAHVIYETLVLLCRQMGSGRQRLVAPTRVC